MRKVLFFLKIIALVMVIVFSITACKNDVIDSTVFVESVSLNKTTLTLAIGDEEILIATVQPPNVSDKKITWVSSNKDVATVDQNSKITAIGEGTAIITVTTLDGGREASCTVTVSNTVNFILGAWDNTEKKWKLAEIGVTAEHFSLLDINGIEDGNFDAITEWFNILCLSGSAPDDLAGLKTLVDAALVGMANYDEVFCNADIYAHHDAAKAAMEGLIKNGSTIIFGNWVTTDDNDSIIITVGGKYSVIIHFSGIVKTSITSVAITVINPVTGAEPVTTAPTGGTGYICSEVLWSPDNNPFQSRTMYTATVMLTANDNYTFNGLTDATINGQGETIKIIIDDTSVKLSYTFTATSDNIVTSITVLTQPINQVYTHGQTLNLTGLIVQLVYNDGFTEDVSFDNFGDKIYTNPAYNDRLTHVHNDNMPVIVYCGNRTTTTASLTVRRKPVDITGLEAASKVYDGTQTANITGMAVLNGRIGSEDVDVDISEATAFFDNKNAGNNKVVTFNGYKLEGEDMDNYILQNQPPDTTANITTKTITITGVTAIDRDYIAGDAIVTLSFTSGTLVDVESIDFGKVSFTPDNGTMADANAGSNKLVNTNITLTGEESGNYTLLQPSVTVTINKIDPIVTWPTGATIFYHQTLADAVFTGQGGSGTFAFTNSAIEPDIGDSGTEYEVTFIPDDIINYNIIMYYISITVNKAAGSAVTQPTVSETVTEDSITVAAVALITLTGQDIEYAISTLGNANLNNLDWTVDKLTFTDLNSGTAYYVYARSVENDNYSTGTPNVSDRIRTYTIPIINITINIIAEAAPIIIGPTIYRSGSEGRPTTATITIENPEQYSNIRWSVTGTGLGGTGDSFTLNTAYRALSLAGDYFLTVEVIKDSIPYSRTVTFTVME